MVEMPALWCSQGCSEEDTSTFTDDIGVFTQPRWFADLDPWP